MGEKVFPGRQVEIARTCPRRRASRMVRCFSDQGVISILPPVNGRAGIAEYFWCQRYGSNNWSRVVVVSADGDCRMVGLERRLWMEHDIGIIGGTQRVRRTRILVRTESPRKAARAAMMVFRLRCSRPSRSARPQPAESLRPRPRAASPSASLARASALCPAIIGVSPWIKHLRSRIRSSGDEYRLSRFLATAGLDHFAQAAREPGIDVVGRDQLHVLCRRACASPLEGSRRRMGPGR